MAEFSGLSRGFPWNGVGLSFIGFSVIHPSVGLGGSRGAGHLWVLPPDLPCGALDGEEIPGAIRRFAAFGRPLFFRPSKPDREPHVSGGEVAGRLWGQVLILEMMAVYNSTQVLLNVYEVAAILYDALSSDFQLDTLRGPQIVTLCPFHHTHCDPYQAKEHRGATDLAAISLQAAHHGQMVIQLRA